MKKERPLFTMCRKKFLSLILSLCVFSVYSVSIYAQVNIRGMVTDSNNEPLIGVNVIVKDSREGTVTNIDGEFILAVPNANTILEFSYVGFQTQEVVLDGKTFVSVIMFEDTELLEEVVVVGYGTQKKVSVTGSVAQISSREITQAPRVIYLLY